jgi:type IV pilus assembly protein PilE
MRKLRGFTTIEILVVVFIITTLVTVSIPLYSSYLVRQNRLAAADILLQLASALEQHYTQNNSYLHATLENLKFPENIVQGRYQLVINTLTDSNYYLAAQPLGKQATMDAICGSLTLTSRMEKGITGGGRADKCW